MEEFKSLLVLAGGLVSFMVANIVLGTINAGIKQEFDKTVLLNGIQKALGIAIGFMAIYLGGLCVPDMKFAIGEQQLTTLQILQYAFTGGIVTYAVKAFKNMFKLFGAETTVESVPTNFDELPEETELNDTEGVG